VATSVKVSFSPVEGAANDAPRISQLDLRGNFEAGKGEKKKERREEKTKGGKRMRENTPTPQINF